LAQVLVCLFYSFEDYDDKNQTTTTTETTTTSTTIQQWKFLSKHANKLEQDEDGFYIDSRNGIFDERRS